MTWTNASDGRYGPSTNSASFGGKFNDICGDQSSNRLRATLFNAEMPFGKQSERSPSAKATNISAMKLRGDMILRRHASSHYSGIM